MTDFLQEKRNEINERLAELKPLVDEYRRLEAAVAAFDGIPASPNGATAPTPRPARGGRRPGRPRGSRRASTAVAEAAPAVATSAAKPATKRASARSAAKARIAGKRAGGRLKGTGKRPSEALAIIQGQPGVTVPEIASKMGIKQNYLYRILPELERGSTVRKEGRGWHPVAAKAAA